jgi:UDPglucose 6-dehydrogenase
VNVGFVGLGKLGLPTALAIEARGHVVVATDPSPAVAQILSTRKLAHREAGAEALLERTRIELLPLAETVRRSEILFVTIQTPHDPRYEGITRLPEQGRDFDLGFLRDGMAEVGQAIEALGEERVVVLVSTVLPGTIRRDILPLVGPHTRLCYNPFFIAMGTAVHDFLHPEFVLFGVTDPRAAEVAQRFYATLHSVPFHCTTLEEAEVIKVLYNTFVSTKIAFANTAMELCHHVANTDVDVVLGVLRDATDRIVSGKYLGAGMGDGGACHPRDNIALSHLSRQLGLSFDWFRAVIEQRERQTEWLAELIASHARGRDVVLLGRSFKPESNILTGSPALLLEGFVRERGLKVLAWDPHVDAEPAPAGRPLCYFIGTRHAAFERWPFEPGSVVLDPFRYVEVPVGVELIPIGRGRPT